MMAIAGIMMGNPMKTITVWNKKYSGTLLKTTLITHFAEYPNLKFQNFSEIETIDLKNDC